MRNLTGLSTALVALMATASDASAQETPGSYLYVVTLTTNPGSAAEFVQYEMRINEARERIGDPRTVLVYQTRMGGPLNTYRVVIPFEDYEEIATWPTIPELLRRAYGASEGARILAEGSAHLTSVEAAVLTLQPDVTSGASLQPTGLRYSQVVTTQVDPALSEDYATFLRALRVAEDRRGIRRIRRTNAMGPTFTYYAIRQFDSLADVTTVPGPGALLSAEYGEEVGAAIIARADAAVVSRTIELVELREDLSHIPE